MTGLEQRIIACAAQLTGMDASEISIHSKLCDDLRFDSLDHLDFTMKVEDEFRVEITDEECAAWTTLRDVEATLRSKASVTAGP